MYYPTQIDANGNELNHPEEISSRLTSANGMNKNSRNYKLEQMKLDMLSKNPQCLGEGASGSSGFPGYANENIAQFKRISIP